jgi:hypothetical protein
MGIRTANVYQNMPTMGGPRIEIIGVTRPRVEGHCVAHLRLARLTGPARRNTPRT